MADTQWNIEHLLATAVAYMRDVGMPNEADAIIELQRRAATQPADAALADARAQKHVGIAIGDATYDGQQLRTIVVGSTHINHGDKLYAAAPVPAQPAVPEAVAKDWIPHDGGLRPVDPDTKVIGLRRDGEQTITCRASFLHWEWAGFRDEGRQLVGYRILSATDTEVKK